jgi:hypothetical protein
MKTQKWILDLIFKLEKFMQLTKGKTPCFNLNYAIKRTLDRAYKERKEIYSGIVLHEKTSEYHEKEKKIIEDIEKKKNEIKLPDNPTEKQIEEHHEKSVKLNKEQDKLIEELQKEYNEVIEFNKGVQKAFEKDVLTKEILFEPYYADAENEQLKKLDLDYDLTCLISDIIK